MSKPTYEELEKRVKELEESDSNYSQSDERLLNSFIDQNPFPTWISDEKGTMIRANSALKKVLNLTDEQLIGKYNVLKDPQVEEQGLIQVVRDTLEKGKTSDFVLVWDGYNVTDVKLEGSKKVDVEGTIFPIFDNDGNVTNAVITYKEVSERKKAEELLLKSEEKYRSLVNDIPDVIWTGDIDGKSYFLSNNVESMLGYTTQEIYEGGEDFVFDRIHPEDVGRIRTCYQNLFRKETSFDEEYRFQRKDGEWVWLRDKATEIYEKDGVKYVNGIFSDITEQKKAEDALHSEKLFSEEYINSMPGLFYVFDKKRFVRWNKNWTAVTGYSDEELAAMNGKDFFEGEDRKLIGERMLKVFKEGVADAEAELVTKDGRRIFYYFTGQRKVLGGNEYLIGLGIDITEKMKAEKALRESQKKLLDAQYISKMGGFTWNIQTGEASWSEGMYRLLKYDIDETIDYAKVNKNIHHPEDLERVTEWLSDSIASGKKELVPNEYRIICKDGEIIDVQTNGRIEYEGGKAIKLFGTSLNITERRKADAQQKAIHEISQSVVTTENMDEFYSEVHKSLDSVIDTTNIFIALHEEDSEHIAFPYWVDERDGAPLQMSLKDSMSGTAEVILSGKSMFNTEKDYREMIVEGKIELHGSASKVWLGVPLKTKERTIGALVVQSYKDTKLFSEEDVQFLEVIADSIANAIQHMKSEEALKESEEKYQDLYDNAPDMFCSVDAETAKITQCNTTLCDRTGYSREEIIGRPIFEMYHPESLDGAEKAFMSFGETGVVNNAELQLMRKDGSKIDVMLNVTSTKDEKGNVLMSRSVWRDITDIRKANEEKVKLEDQLIQAQKMESIGRLAGGIAHDFNNILVGVMGYAELLKMKHPDDSSDEGEAAGIILNGAERASDLTKQLLGFARGGKYNPVPLKINEVIKDTVRVSEKIFEKKITVKFDFEKKNNTIDADKNQLDQILTNLIINAKDAMPLGGELSFKTENVYLDEEYVKIHPYFKPGNYVKLSVTDSGTGMTQDIKESIFEPFFTTKGEGKGTGLGLSTVYGIVKNHGGHINVYSEPGEGTTFTLYFPVSEKEITDVVDVRQVYEGDATILVVDDEENVRQYAEKILKKLGHTVLLAKDGKEAVKIYKQKKDEIDLVLLDMIMPKMDGKETNLALRKTNPDVRILLASGYSQNGSATEILNEGAIGFIQKPFRADELSKAIVVALKQ